MTLHTTRHTRFACHATTFLSASCGFLLRISFLLHQKKTLKFPLSHEGTGTALSICYDKFFSYKHAQQDVEQTLLFPSSTPQQTPVLVWALISFYIAEEIQDLTTNLAHVHAFAYVSLRSFTK